MAKYLFILAIIIGFIYPAHAQQYPLLQYTIDNGLPSNNINAVYRDNNGFIWFATDKGVARHNGIRFDVFTTFNGMPDNNVTELLQDKHNNLWMITANGNICYFRNDSFYAATNNKTIAALRLLGKAKHLIPQKDSSIIISYHGAAIFANATTSKYNAIKLSPLKDRKNLGRLLHYAKINTNRYTLIFSNEKIIVDTQMNIRQRFDIDTLRTDSAGLRDCYSNFQNQPYLYNKDNFYSPDMKPCGHFPEYLHTNNVLNGIILIGGNRYFATNNGIFINDSLHTLPGNNITGITVGLFGNVWIGTSNNGVYVLKNRFNETRLFKGAYSGIALYAYGMANQLYYATSSGNCYVISSNFQDMLLSYQSIRIDSRKLFTSQAYHINNNGAFCAIINSDLIYKTNINLPATSVHRVDWQQNISAIHQLNNYYYFQKPNGIIKLNSAAFSSKQVKGMQCSLMKNDEVINYMTTSADAIWFATQYGLYKITDTGTISYQKKFKNIRFKSFSFLANNIIGLTYNNELLIAHTETQAPKIDSIKPDNCIWDKFYPLDAAHLLIATNNQYRLLSIDNSGKYRIEVLDNAFIPLQPETITSDGKSVYFLKNGDITQISTNSIYTIPPPPRLTFTNLRSGDFIYNIQQSLSIPYSDAKNMTISFATITAPGSKVLYQYSLSKNKTDYWTNIKNEDINLINAGFGNYTVKVRAKNMAGTFSSPIEFTLNINRPFWATWWFILLALSAVTYAIVYIVRTRIALALAKKEKEHANKVRFLKSEYKALNALMNPHFIFNTLNNVQGLINKNEKQAANEYLRVIADLIRQNMHNISKELIPLQKEIDLVANYLLLEKLRFNDKLNYTFNIDEDVDLTEIMIPPLLIQPLVENSIKHGILPLENKPGNITLSIYEKDQLLYIEVKDNGVGLSAKKQANPNHESFGLENIRKRIQQLSVIQGKEITFNLTEQLHNVSSYTLAIITIPLHT